VGLVQLVFSTRKSPRETGKIEAEKILMTADLKLSTRMIVELYTLRWQIELFFKRNESPRWEWSIIASRQFERVERWVEMALVHLSLPGVGIEAGQLRRPAVREKSEVRLWQARHGLCQAIRQQAACADLQYLGRTGCKRPCANPAIASRICTARLPRPEYRSPL